LFATRNHQSPKRAIEKVITMTKNRAKDVSLVTFGEAYFKIQKANGTREDLMAECEMESMGSVGQKLVELKKQFASSGHGELPALRRKGRGAKSGETVGQTAANRLAALYAGTITLDDDNTDDTVSATNSEGFVELSKTVHELASKASDFTKVVDKAETQLTNMSHPT
jgi:hypothetical protein